MRPSIRLLSEELVDRILGEAFQLLEQVGVKVLVREAQQLLASAGATVDTGRDVVHIPEKLARQALAAAPREFDLFNLAGEATVHYGGDIVQFDPGSSGVNVLDPLTLEHRPARTEDLLRVIKLAEMLPAYDAQSTALVCSEIPKEIGDLYRLYLVLLFSAKPIITGAFSISTTGSMVEMLAIVAGGSEALAERPRAVFDVCPSPPLVWSEFGAQNLVDLARARVPVEIVSMPLAGAAGPVTLLGCVVQHAAESISGITLHQLARPGAPIVWGGAPAIMDMRHGTTPMGAVETAMIDAAYAEVGKHLGLPTHTYLVASDSKLLDAQAGLESGMSALIGAMAGINMISGAGMLDFLACLSPEKLVLDAEAIGMVRRFLEGMKVHTETLALSMFEDFAFKGEFLRQKITRRLFREEQFLPSEVIDRGSIRAWDQEGRMDTMARAHARVEQLLRVYQPPDLAPARAKELVQLVRRLGAAAGMGRLPYEPTT
jgi:trimethylamine--corrinoid protein Co-methyltransferase